MSPHIQAFFDESSGTFTYVVFAQAGGECAIVDCVLDYDPVSGRTGTTHADVIVAYVTEQNLRVQWLLETHAHADHLSAAPYLRSRLGGKIAIGEAIKQVQGAFKNIFNLEPEFRLDGSQFDYLLQADEEFMIGTLRAKALHVPGHTPADMAYQIEDSSVLVGDTLFMPDLGSARCDFPGGDARQLYRSMKKLLALPPATQLYVCHDYPPETRQARCQTSVAEQRASNVHVGDGIDEDSFVAMRNQRDASLGMPRLLLPAIQVNIRAGELPPAEANGLRYLKIPLNGM